MTTTAAAATVGRRFRPTPNTGVPPGDVTLVSIYTLDSGSAADSGSGGVNGTVVGTWTATNTGSLATGVSGTSMYKDGSTAAHITLPSGNAAHNLSEVSFGFYYQPVLNANKHVLFALGDGSAVGDLSIERLTNGRLRGWHVGQDGGLRFWESTDGVAATNLVLDTAYRITVTLGSGGSKLYLNSTLVATIVENTDGWNNARVKYIGVWSDATTDRAQGLIDHFRVWSGVLTASGVSGLEAAQSVSSPSTGEFITTPEDHGWDAGNTDQQNTGFFQDAIDFANANAGSSSTGRGVVELVQGKTYTVRVASNGTSSSSPVNALTAKSNVEIRTVGLPTRASGNQATIQWHSWSGFGSASIKHRNLLWVSNISNFRCTSVKFDGRKNTMANNDVPDYTSGTNGGMNCLSFRNTISNIVFREVTSTHAITDALLFNCEAATSVLLEDCTLTRARRNGMSMAKANTADSGHDQVIFRRVAFSECGDQVGDIEGMQPGWGVDVEPDQTSEHQHGITWDTCTFTNNRGSLYINGDQTTSTLFGLGLAFDSKAQSDKIKILNCTASGNITRGFSLGLRQAPTWDDWLVEDNVATGNGSNAFTISASGSGTGGTMTNATFINNNVTQYLWEAGAFGSGWSVTIWRGDFNPTVTTNGTTTITNNAGFPP